MNVRVFDRRNVDEILGTIEYSTPVVLTVLVYRPWDSVKSLTAFISGFRKAVT